MKKMKKLILASAALLTCASAVVGISALNPVTAKAEDAFCINGASVRTKDPSGIRFLTIVEGGKQEGYEYGTLIIPKADFTGANLTVDTPNVVAIKAERWRSDTEFTVALGGVEKDDGFEDFPQAQYNNEIYACSYAKDANGEYTYTAMISRTLAQVASVALTDTTDANKITDTEERSYLAGICDYVLGDDGFALTQTSMDVMIGETLDLTSVFATNNGNEGLKAIWSVADGENCVTVNKDEMGAIVSIDAKEAGTVTLQAQIGSKTAELTVTTKAREIAANEVIDFISSKDMSYVTNREGIESMSYMESFEGAQGVLRVEDTDGWTVLGIKTINSIKTYQSYKYLVIRMYATGASTFKIAKPYSYSINKVKVNEWVDYYFDGAAFLNQWEDQGNYYSSLFIGTKGMYYIDKIYMSSIFNPNVEEVNYFDVEPTNIITGGTNPAPTTEYLEEFQGAQGVLKVTSEYWGVTYFPAVKSIHDYDGFNRVVMRIWSENSGCNFNLNNDGNDFAINTPKKSVANQWFDYYFTFEDFKEAWSRGDYLKGLATFGTGGTYYIDAVYMTNTSLVTNGEILPFDSKDDIGNITGKTDTSAYGNVEWLETEHGKSGVVKLTYTCNNDEGQGFSFKPVVDMSNYADYTHIVIRARTIKNTEGASLYVSGGFNFGYETGVDKKPIGYEGWTYDDTWIDYKFEIAPFLKAWTFDGSVNANDGSARIWFKAAALNGGEVTGSGYIYIDAIYAIKE